MGFTDAVKSCLGKYTAFSGRAPRSEYWWFVFFSFIASFFISILFSLLGYICGDIAGAYIAYCVGIAFVYLSLFLPSLAVIVRRLHDTGHSGFWYFITFVPLIGGFWFLYLMLKGSDEENEYGLPIY